MRGDADGAASKDADEAEATSSPAGQAERWAKEFAAARKELKSWQKEGEDILKRYLDERDGLDGSSTKWNFFPANVQMKEAVLYGRPPQVSVTRRFEDTNDELARVAAEMKERLLNTDIQRDTDDYASSLRYVLKDRLTVGIGIARLRYVVEHEAASELTPAVVDPSTGQEQAPEVPPEEVKASEDVETLYVHWNDALWSPARTWGEVRWFAFKAQMTRKELTKRFGKIGKQVPLNAKKPTGSSDLRNNRPDPWSRADVWEIWDKENEQVTWYVEGFGQTLETKDDPYQLDGFWPMPCPLMANITTGKLVPRPDFALAKDLYDEIDEISCRIKLLEQAISVRGVYDKNSKEIRDILSTARRNQMVPVPNWGAFAEKGGIKGAVDWFPLDMVIAAMDKLREYRQELIQTLAQLDGTSDIMRGQQMENGTPGEAQMKAKFAGIRMQQLQEEFAQYASDLQRIRGELIARFFDVETILKRSNAMNSMDANLAVQAAQFIKDTHSALRIEVEPEALAQADFASMKSERTEFLSAMSGFIQAAAPLAQMMPGSMPVLMEVLKWTLSSLKGSSSIGGVFDQAIAAMQQQQQQQAQQPQQVQQPDPKLMAAQAKAQADQQKIDHETQAELIRMRAETQQLQQRKQTDALINLNQEAAKQRLKVQAAAMMPAKPTTPGGPL